MKNIEILDCTLRDGGYINNWDFGLKNIEYIITTLALANIEYIECGFICDNTQDLNKTLYSNFERIKKIIKKYKSSTFTLMMPVNDYNIDNLEEAPNESNIVIRLSFHKNDFSKAIDYALKIKNKGYKVFLQPTVIKSYTEEEIIYLLKGCNEVIKPDGVAIVDTLGEMNSNDICKITKLFDIYLDKKIKLLFHGHNNLQLAFSNSIIFIENASDSREIIIDTSLMGMGRNSGNVCTELMINYLIQNYNKDYNFDKVLNIINDVMFSLREKYEWGYSPKYMLNAKNRTHPYYLDFLENSKILDLNEINYVLSKIPNNEKPNFNKEIIHSLLSNDKISII